MGPVKDISARFADGAELQALQERGYHRVPTEAGGLWYQPERIVLGDQVHIRELGTPESYSLFVRGAKAV